MIPRRLLFLTVSLLFVYRPCAAAEDMSAPDLSGVIAELEAIKENKVSARQRSLTKAIMDIQDAAKNPSSASRAYGDARRIVEFDGKPNAGPKFAEWKKKQTDLLNSKSLQTASQLHLQYLALTLKQIGESDTEARVTESIQYAQELAAAQASMNADLNAFNETKDLLNKPLQEGFFAKANDLSELLKNQKDWELVAGNLDGILEKNVRRILREKKDPRIMDTWDLQLKLEDEIAGKAATSITETSFTNTRRPQLLWRKANELVTMGQPIRGLSGMLEVIRANPTHPDIDQWVETASSLATSQMKSKE